MSVLQDIDDAGYIQESEPSYPQARPLRITRGACERRQGGSDNGNTELPADRVPSEDPPPTRSIAVEEALIPRPAAAAVEPHTLAVALDATLRYVERYVCFPSEHEAIAVVLWIAHAWAIDAADTSPFLAVTSPTKQSGKSRLFEVIEQLVPKPWRVVSPSEAVTFRKINQDKPTMLLDEADTVFGTRRSREANEPLRAILSAGNRRGTSVPRMVGEGKRMHVEDFGVFCPKALAGIGDLPDTVADRSIPIRMQRRGRSESVEPFRVRDAEPLAVPIREALEAAVEPMVDPLADARPTIPTGLSDRAADGWEPLLAIAEAARGGWAERTRRAAAALSGTMERDLDDAPIGVLLLAAIRTIFERRDEDRVTSAHLVQDLAADAGGPWATFGRDGKPITQHSISRHLRHYEIRPKRHRFGDLVERGYLRADFEVAWDRYLPPPERPSERQHVNKNDAPRHEGETSGTGSGMDVDVLTLWTPSGEAQEGDIEDDYPPSAWRVE